MSEQDKEYFRSLPKLPDHERLHYTGQQLDFLEGKDEDVPIKDFTKLFNSKFGTDKTPEALATKLRSLSPTKSKSSKRQLYSKKEDKLILEGFSKKLSSEQIAESLKSYVNNVDVFPRSATSVNLRLGRLKERTQYILTSRGLSNADISNLTAEQIVELIQSREEIHEESIDLESEVANFNLDDLF